MNKYAEIMMKRKPNFEIECQNCKKKFSVKTKDMLSGNDVYLAECPNCHKTTEIKGLKQLVKDFEQTIKNAGLKIK